MVADKVRDYLVRNGVNTEGFSQRGIDLRAIEIATASIGKRANLARMTRDDATLETIAVGLVALDAEDAK
jgi:hypothetical protein